MYIQVSGVVMHLLFISPERRKVLEKNAIIFFRMIFFMLHPVKQQVDCHAPWYGRVTNFMALTTEMLLGVLELFSIY